MYCGRSVDTKCEHCRVWLCVALEADNNSTCFKEFHTLPSFENRNSVVTEDGSDEEEEKADKDS